MVQPGDATAFGVTKEKNKCCQRTCSFKVFVMCTALLWPLFVLVMMVRTSGTPFPRSCICLWQSDSVQVVDLMSSLRCQQWLCQRGCGFLWLWTWVVRTARCRPVRDASGRDCVALTGTQRIETCLKGWGIEFCFLTAEWPFGSRGGQDRDGFCSRLLCSPQLLPQN